MALALKQVLIGVKESQKDYDNPVCNCSGKEALGIIGVYEIDMHLIGQGKYISEGFMDKSITEWREIRQVKE